MAWSFVDWFTRRNRTFRRPEENNLMLEQYLAGLDARHVHLASTLDPRQKPILDEAAKVIERYRDFRNSRAGPSPTALPDWNDALIADQLMTRLLPSDEARAALAMQLAALRSVDPSAFSALSIEWEGVKSDPAKADARAPALLSNALMAFQWKNTQRWIIRTLGTQYASRLRTAFLFGLVICLSLIVLDARWGADLRGAALSGLGFAAAAGLLGASFSAMVGHGDISKLDSIEEARAATGWQMITLRLGVGVASAIIIYFFFESGLVEGALFPNLQQIGFGRVTPPTSELEQLRGTVQALRASVDALGGAVVSANAQVAGLWEVTAVGGHPDDINAKMQVTMPALEEVERQIADLKGAWEQRGEPLGWLTPNPDLSKLVVWCFAAGFTQTLVPSMLAKVSSSSEKDE